MNRASSKGNTEKINFTAIGISDRNPPNNSLLRCRLYGGFLSDISEGKKLELFFFCSGKNANIAAHRERNAKVKKMNGVI